MRTFAWGVVVVVLLAAGHFPVRTASVVRELPSSRRGSGPEWEAWQVPPRWPRLVVESTAYCLRGAMANGKQVHDGAVAMNRVRFGTRFRIETGPLAGRVVTVADRIVHSSEFDVWFASCRAALDYGRKWIQVTQL